MKFTRRFSAEGLSFGGVEFVKRDSIIKTPTGTVIFSLSGIMVPVDWSQNAVDVLAQKYFRKAGVADHFQKIDSVKAPDWLKPSRPADGPRVFSGEFDARQVFTRMAGAWTYEGWHAGYFDSEDDAKIFYEDIQAMLARQMFAPNSPQWFNTGLWWAYGIKAEGQELFKVDTPTERPNNQAALQDVAQISESYRNPMSYACFIQGIEDKLVGDGSILDLAEREAKVFKFGGGCGSNFSSLRGLGEPLTAGGSSSGLMSFLPGFDRFAGAIKSGGSTRRAAKMAILDIDHPDILEFVGWKVKEEEKVAILAAGSVLLGNHANAILSAAKDGADLVKNAKLKRAVSKALRDGLPGPYVRRLLGLAAEGVTSVTVPIFDCDWQGEAYRTVSGQNSNNTVRVTDYFMSNAKTEKPHSLFWRTELAKAKRENRPPKPYSQMPHRDLWGAIIDSAWKCADPGINFGDTVNEWHLCPADGQIHATNPCSEFIFLDDNGCNLASLNIGAFLANGKFDCDSYIHAARIVTIILGITVTMSSFPSAPIAMNSHNFRTLGLGYCNVGGTLMREGIPYDSDEGREVCAALTCLLHSVALSTSAEIAEKLGAFPRYHDNRQNIWRVVNNHAALAGVTGRDIAGLSKRHHKLDHDKAPGNWNEVSMKARFWAKIACARVEKHGLRNAQVTNIAPTGTIGIVMDADTTGIEPDFALVKFKTLAGGGFLKIVNQAIPAALWNLGYSNYEIPKIVDYIRGTGTFTGCPHYEKLAAKLTPAQISEFTAKAATAVDIRHLGYDEISRKSIFETVLTSAELAEVNGYVCGTGTIEGAPGFKPEHLPVFDCANKCGRGVRSLDWRAHVRMMCAAQSWISGGISKTINLPSTATRADVGEAYLMTWELGGKSIALYRDDSKLSQPLAAGDSAIAAAMEDAPEELKTAERVISKIITNRRQLPDRRAGYTQKVRIGSHKIYLRTGEYPDGALGEIFVDMHKEGAAYRSLMNCFCIAISLGLQHGVPLDEFVDKFIFTRFEPNGVVQNHARLKNATSIIDLVFRELAITYLNRDDLAHVKAEDMPAPLDAASETQDQATDHHSRPTTVNVKVPSVARTKAAEARGKGYTGNFCSICGSCAMVRSGSCERCDICGDTSGCS